ncbi:MAG: hypothetical protein HOW73_44745 [Polyangiaceae bacterium]|nr:hypothetical protein [Polyangiaceae bacterium]
MRITAVLLLALTSCAATVEVEDDGDVSPADEPPACEALTLVGDGDGAYDVALDETRAFWTDGSNVFAASLATGEAERRVENGGWIRYLAIDDSYVYAVDDEPEGVDGGVLFRFPKAGGTREDLGAGIAHAAGLEVAGGEVFVLDMGRGAEGLDEPEPRDARIWRWSPATGLAAVAERLEGYVGNLMVDGSDIILRSARLEPARTELVVVSRASGAIETRPFEGDVMALSGDSIVSADSGPNGWSVSSYERATKGGSLIGTLKAPEGMLALVTAGDDAYFAVNTVVYGYEDYEAAPQVYRMDLGTGAVVQFPYAEVIGDLTARAANDVHVAFGRTHVESSDPFDADVILFCQ